MTIASCECGAKTVMYEPPARNEYRKCKCPWPKLKGFAPPDVACSEWVDVLIEKVERKISNIESNRHGQGAGYKHGELMQLRWFRYELQAYRVGASTVGSLDDVQGSEVPTQKAPTDSSKEKGNASCLAAPSRNLCDKIFDHKWLDPECVEKGCQSLVLKRAAARVEPTKEEK